MAYDPSNLFAKIIAGEIPSHKIFETPHAVAILDAFPLVEGHALLLPKHPCVDVTDMPPDVAASVLKELPRLARLVQQATGADGVNIVQNSGKAAGQVVFHCHFHVIPRFDSDQKPIAFGASRKSMISGDEAASVLSRMKEPYAGSLSAIEELMGEMRAGSVTKPAAAAASKPAAAKPAAKQEAKPAKQESKEKPAAAKPAKQEAKEAKDKPAKEAAPPKKAAPAADRPLDISYADIRVGKIIDAKPHPDSDKLFVETIELGEPAPRQILSGLGHHMKLEQVKGADVVCICNLKARKLAGLESNGMVLCASDAEKSNLAFVVPPPGSKPGDRVTFAGYPGEPETPKQMDKKKIWELVQPEFSTDASGTACYKGVPYSVAGGVCSSAVKNGIIS